MVHKEDKCCYNCVNFLSDTDGMRVECWLDGECRGAVLFSDTCKYWEGHKNGRDKA